MALRDLLAAHAAMHLDSECGFGEELLHLSGGTETVFTGIWDQQDERGQLRIDRSGDDTTRQNATVDVPVDMVIAPEDFVRRYGEDWTVTGVDGRDQYLKTVSLVRNRTKTHRKAKN